MGIEIIKDDMEFSGPGRPMEKRTAELYRAIKEAKDAGEYGLRIDLDEDEQDKFYRFTQRCRSAAKKAGVKVNVSVVRDDHTKGAVRILEGGKR